MNEYQSSIVIPVYNKWELTRNCLKSLAKTTDHNRVEVIVVDNASSDVTPKACTFLGEKLFGSGFRFIRNEQNRNFSGACNQGAEAARGKYIIFLNNDTVAEAGWHDPLIQDFSTYPGIAATGPLLVYPEQTPFGRLVQHLGVIISPYLKAGHLYQGLPESSALANKRRFFQAITGACFAIPKALFMKAGQFDEGYINGFEDVDLCARLTGMAYRFTINPEATVVHYEGQTPGRGRNESDNFSRLLNSNLKYLQPDWLSQLELDGFTMEVDDWLSFRPQLAPQVEEILKRKLPEHGFEELKGLLADHIYWEDGWQKLLSLPQAQDEYPDYFSIYFRFFRNVPNAASALEIGRKYGSNQLLQQGSDFLRFCDRPPEDLLADAKAASEYCKKFGMPKLGALYDRWIANYKYFKESLYQRYRHDYFSLLGEQA